MHVTRNLRVLGLVQGVGFREALLAEAERLGVRGWVRNRRDGSVEAVAQGVPPAVDALIAWARRGPPAARVTQVDVQPAAAEFDRIYPDFDRLPTA